MSLNLKELLVGGPARLRWTYRYSTCRVRHQESVAEHSYYVALYCAMISEWLWENHRIAVKTSELLTRALLHDLEECETGDFPRRFKHSSPEMHDTLERAATSSIQRVLGRLWGRSQEADHFFHMWKNAKEPDSWEGRILEFADFLAVLAFIMQEGQGEGNGTIGIHVAGMPEYLARFEGPNYDFIRPLVQQAGEMLNEVLR